MQVDYIIITVSGVYIPHSHITDPQCELAIMSNLVNMSTTIGCVPHYKEDAERPWITQDGLWGISVWLSPKSGIMLSDVAKLIEDKIAANSTSAVNVNQTVVAATNVQQQGTVQSMTFRGQMIPRPQMSNSRAVDYLHDGETFDLFVNISMLSDTRVRMDYPKLCCSIL